MLFSCVNPDVTCFLALDDLESAVTKLSPRGECSKAVVRCALKWSNLHTCHFHLRALEHKQMLLLPKDLETTAVCSRSSDLPLLMALSYCLEAAQKNYPVLD